MPFSLQDLARKADALFADRHKRFEDFQEFHLEAIELFGASGPKLGAVAQDILANPIKQKSGQDQRGWGLELSMIDYAWWANEYAKDPRIIMLPVDQIRAKVSAGILRNIERLSGHLDTKEEYVAIARELAASLRSGAAK